MARLREEEINQIRAKADIVDIIGRYVPLTRKGKNYWCTCPFHDDHSPSMSIASDKQIYKCFVCNAGGNVFTFVSNYEKISFIEAVYKVAEYVGVPIEHTLDIPQRVVDPHKEALYKTCKDTIEFTHYHMDTLDAHNVKEYLSSRLIDESIIKKFELGYNPPDDALYKFLHAKKHADEDIIGAGVCRLSSIGMKDVFANRITIPIHNEFGEPVGFSARRILDNDDAKYINTNETDIYIKGNLIFNYHRAKEEARKQKKVYLVEGAMDVLSFEKIGLSNALATLGTACTKEQILLLKKLHAPIILCYDGDGAGRNATYKFGKLARQYQMEFEVVDNKFGLDPDEVIEEFGKEELKHMVERTISWIDFLFGYLVTKYNLENYTQKKELAIEMAEEINALKDDFEKESYFVRLRELTEFDMRPEPTKETKTETKKKDIYQKRTYLTFPKSGRMHAEYQILSQMLSGVAASNYYKEELGFLKDDMSNKLAIYIIDYYRTHQHIEIADLLDVIKEEPVKKLLLEIANWELAQDDVNMEVLHEAIHKVKACFMDDKIAMINEKIKQIHDPLEKAKLANEKNQLIIERDDWRSAGRK
ncbi:DNA primase [Amedibacillus sp. YH-ame6]